MRNSILISLVWTITSCLAPRISGTTKAVTVNNVPIYKDFITAVPELEVPFQFTCGIEKLKLNSDQRYELRPFTPAGYEIVGKLSINPNYNLLICGVLDENKYKPVLYVTNNQGMTVGLHNITEQSCNKDSTYKIKYLIRTESYDQVVVEETKVYSDVRSEDQQTTIRKFQIDGAGEIRMK